MSAQPWPDAEIRLVAAADDWDGLADREIDMAGFEAKRGNNVDSYYFRAKAYRRTAEAIRREARAGVPYCSTCGGPHANDQHGYHEYSGCVCDQPTCPWCGERINGV